MRRSAGRPKKLRKKGNDETVHIGDVAGNGGVLPRQLKTVKCMKCKKYGHNSRTRKGKSAADRQLPKGANKQKKTKGKAGPSGGTSCRPTVQAAGPSGPSVHPAGPQVNDAGPSMKVAGVSQKRNKQRTKAKDVEVVVSQGSQDPQTQPSQD